MRPEAPQETMPKVPGAMSRQDGGPARDKDYETRGDSMIRMRIKNVIVGAGPLPSAVVLRPAEAGEGNRYDKGSLEVEVADEQDREQASLNVLPLSVGTVEAACIARGIDGVERPRPMTHELLRTVIDVLGGKLESASINRVEGATFYASLNVFDASGAEHHIDARPSDAIALAVRAEVPVYASEDVLESAGMPDFDAIKRDEQAREEQDFHDFVENLSPADFNTAGQK